MAFTRLCKRTGGNHLRLEAGQGHKPRRDNARGPGLLMDQSAWQSRILHMPHPLFWINIRPITLISAVLKWFSQFLLRGSATASRGSKRRRGGEKVGSVVVSLDGICMRRSELDSLCQ